MRGPLRSVLENRTCAFLEVDSLTLQGWKLGLRMLPKISQLTWSAWNVSPGVSDSAACYLGQCVPFLQGHCSPRVDSPQRHRGSRAVFRLGAVLAHWLTQGHRLQCQDSENVSRTAPHLSRLLPIPAPTLFALCLVGFCFSPQSGARGQQHRHPWAPAGPAGSRPTPHLLSSHLQSPADSLTFTLQEGVWRPTCHLGRLLTTAISPGPASGRCLGLGFPQLGSRLHEGNVSAALSVLASLSWQQERCCPALPGCVLPPVGELSLRPHVPGRCSSLSSLWPGCTAARSSAGVSGLTCRALALAEGKGRRAADVDLGGVWADLLALKVLQRVGLVRSEHCGVLAEWPAARF
ncbi:uncharacterized protein [Oryctolagus cuniculus]|uniref:uncharacterized protein n=1 Tax=Oryctolagus cuniculus TaxID=9986 RepID=UPI0038795B41